MDKRQRIIITMLELVVKYGAHATPVSRVAKEARVSVGTIYHYFEDKNEIFNEIYKMIRKDFGTLLHQNKSDRTPKDIFRTYWLNIYNYYLSNPLAFKFYEYIAQPPLISESLANVTKEYYTEHTEFFWKGVKSGFLKDMRVSLLVQIAYSNIVAVVNLKHRYNIDLTDIEIEKAVEASWDAVKM